MAKNTNNDIQVITPKRRDKWCGCFLTVGIILLVLFVAAIAIGLGIGDKILKQNFDIGIRDCFKIVAGISDADEDDIVTDPVKTEDTQELYSDLRGALFLNDNVDIEAFVNDLLGSMGGESGGVRTASAEESGENQPLDLLTQLYSEENVDYARMRQFINGEKNIDDVYEQEFVLKIQGNSFAGIINGTLKDALLSAESGEDVALIANNIDVRQITFSKNGDDPVITVIIRIDVKNIAEKYIADMEREFVEMGVPDFAISMIKNAIPEKIFVGADLILSEQAQVNIRLNEISDQSMDKAFALIDRLSGGEANIKQSINGAVDEMVTSLRQDMPILIDLISNQENGRVKLDAFGMIAEMLNDAQSEAEGDDLTGRDLVAFIAGVLGSDAQNAIEKRLSDDERYADTDWQTTNADALVATMADSFSLAKTYFVNGTDENGNDIVSVENGEVVGVEKMFGRVYSDASGQLYYKRQGGAFKIFVNADKNVLAYGADGYEPFYSTQLHYSVSGKDYTLYQNADASVIYGVAEDGSVMLKNGTYTELTTLYVDAEGNVYSRQNDANTYIECKKEKLTMDVVMNIANSESLTLDDIIKYVDMTALKLNGVDSWNKPIEITDIQLASIAGNMLTEQMEGELGAVEPTLRYAVLTEEDGHNFITVGVQLNTAGFLGDDVMASFVGLIGETLYIELVCDITLGLEDGQYKPTKIVYNDLSQEYTDDLLNSISKVVPDMNLNGMLEDLAVSVRDVINSLNENMPLEFGDGVIRLSSPLDLIKPMLVGEDSTISNQQFVDSINNLLHSDADVAVAGVHATNTDYASENWKSEGVNAFVLNATASLGLKSESFLKDGSSTEYSITKIMDIVKAENFGINSVIDKLDYDTFKAEGFTCWSETIDITDAQLAAAVSEMKDDLSEDLNGAGIEIEYAHVSVEGGKSFITVGVTADTQSLIGGNGLDSFMDIIGDKLYAQLKVDVTLGASEYADSELLLNDLTKAQTDALIDLIESIDSSIEISSMFASVEDVLRDVIEGIDSTLSVEFANGKIILGRTQDLIFDAIYGDVDGYTSDEMVEALTLLATTGDYASTIVVPTDNYEAYWNGVLANQYFVTGVGINELFDSMTKGEDIYSIVKSDIMALKANGGFVDANNKYRHETLADATFKANGAQLSWLIRSNKDSLLSNLLSNPTMFGDVDFVKTDIITNASNVPGVSMTLTLPTMAVIDEAGVSGDTQSLVTNLLGEKIAIEISWYDDESAPTVITLNGMTKEETIKFNKMIYKLTGMNLFDASLDGYDESVVKTVSDNVRKYFGDYFTLGYDAGSGNGYVTMDNLYEIMAEKVFPTTDTKQGLTAQQALEVMKNLYELPETSGAFNASLVEGVSYVSNPAHVNDVKSFVQSSGGISYVTVGAYENFNFTAKTAEIFVTVKYALGLSGEAGDMLPEYVYITMHSTATPKIVGMQLDLNMSTELAYNCELATDDLAMNDALEYYGINIEGAIEKAQGQVKAYILSQF